MKGKKDKKTGLIKKKIYVHAYNMGEVVAYLEEQARQGYVLVSIKGDMFYFNETSPMNVQYMIEIYDKKANYGEISTKSVKDFVESFNKQGWGCLGKKSRYFFFYNKRDDIPKVYINQQEKYKVICNKVALAELFLVFMCVVLYGAIIFNMIFDKTGVLSAADILINEGGKHIIVLCSLFAYFVYMIIRNIRFRNINEDIKHSYKNIKYFDYCSERLTNDMLYITINIYWIVTILELVIDDSMAVAFFSIAAIGIIILSLISKIIKYNIIKKDAKKVPAKKAAVYILLFAIIAGGSIFAMYMNEGQKDYDKDDSLVNVVDLGWMSDKYFIDDDYNEYEFSLFGQYCEGGIKCRAKDETLEDGTFKYEIVKSRFDFVRDSYLNKVLSYNKFKSYNDVDEEQAAKWSANECYVIKDSSDASNYDILLCYEDTMVLIKDAHSNYVQNNVKKIYNKLVG